MSFTKAKLPSFFSFRQAADLVRIGKDFDGGYLVSLSDIEKSDLLIGMGIYDDWSFEREFLERKNVEIYTYDASVNWRYFLKQTLESFLKINNPKLFFHWIRVLVNYKKFFSQKNVHHIEKFVGLNSERDSDCTFLDAIDRTNHNNIFLKIDIEGSEYRFLDDLIEKHHRISGMVIEMHDCDLHLKEINKFINNFKLKLIHIHANNFSPLRLSDKLPLVLELTFSKHAVFSQSNNLPHELDMPNNKKIEEIQLLIED